MEENKPTPVDLEEGLTEDYIKRVKQLMQYQRWRKKRPQMKRDPLLMDKQKKAKRRISNKSRKINQAKARQSRLSK